MLPTTDTPLVWKTNQLWLVSQKESVKSVALPAALSVILKVTVPAAMVKVPPVTLTASKFVPRPVTVSSASSKEKIDPPFSVRPFVNVCRPGLLPGARVLPEVTVSAEPKDPSPLSVPPVPEKVTEGVSAVDEF